jgi:hypothetical protein
MRSSKSALVATSILLQYWLIDWELRPYAKSRYICRTVRSFELILDGQICVIDIDSEYNIFMIEEL